MKSLRQLYVLQILTHSSSSQRYYQMELNVHGFHLWSLLTTTQNHINTRFNLQLGDMWLAYNFNFNMNP